jgi:hypothetical protein
MFKKIVWITLLVAGIGLLVFGAVNRTLAKNTREGETQGGYGRGVTETVTSGEYSGGASNQGQRQGWNESGRGGAGEKNSKADHVDLTGIQTGELSEAETAALLYMREEEKLAGDIYSAFYANWGLRIFQNISQSEQTHTSAVKELLYRYNLVDPVVNQAGVFSNPKLQDLYNELLAQGNQSLAEALKVGGAIEEMDILDLEERLAQIDNADIQQVFNNLKKGSLNHLQAFASTYTRETGQVYQPVYLSADAYQAIVGNLAANGSQGSGGGKGAGGGVERGGGQGGGYRGGRP